MENNEITMLMDVKIDKRPELTRFHQWTRSQVKIEAVKCFPCFLRISLKIESPDNFSDEEQQNFSLSINVPGVNITLASSRTKQHSYALYWTQYRKNCFIYFALDTELSCRRHMKWVRKSIKNLELHRKLLLEERPSSRLGPYAFPQLTLDDFKDDSTWSQQRVSEIYEEIFEGSPQELTEQQRESRRISRRCSRTSIASGIYEEMKLPTDSPLNFDAINEELPITTKAPTPPPLPPFPTQRKRYNTYGIEETPNSSPVQVIPRCSTNPETDLAKKKKLKNMLGIFHGNGLRSKRTVSTTSENSNEQLTTPKQTKAKAVSSIQLESVDTKSPKIKTPLRPLTPTLPKCKPEPVYANDDIIAAKRQKKPERSIPIFNASHSKRNSFSSPDLSKINFVDTFDEQRIAELMNPSFLKCDDLELTDCTSQEEPVLALKTKFRSNNQTTALTTLECQNISTQLPINFNMSACNNSYVNLVAPLSAETSQLEKTPKNEIIIDDDLTGYCVMAPIVRKMSSIDNVALPTTTTVAAISTKPLETVSSGYSTGSYCSSISSTGEQGATKMKTIVDESVVYMNMEEPIKLNEVATPSFLADDFTGNLYENLMALKAERELEVNPIKCETVLSTSTPTESPLLQNVPITNIPTSITNTTTPTSTKVVITTEEGEDFYQAPRKSIISIDEKIPSYYPCESSVKLRRSSYSPTKVNNKNIGTTVKTPTITKPIEKSPTASTNSVISTNSGGFRQLVSSKLRRERKENLTSPQGIIEQRKSTKATNMVTSTKIKKTSAHKISENVYAVKHRLKKSINDQSENICQATSNHIINNNIETKSSNDQADKLDHIVILKNLDFKFEDTNTLEYDKNYDNLSSKSPTTPIRAPLSPCHHLQINQTSNTCHKLRACSVGNSPATTTAINSPTVVAMTQSSIAKTIVAATNDTNLTSGVKKFASLPRFKKFDLSPLRLRINNVLQRNHTPDL